jgi:hypothetical protein
VRGSLNQSTSIVAETVDARSVENFLWIQEQRFLTDRLSAFDRRHRRLVVANQGPTVKLNNRVGVGYSAAVARSGVASARLLSFRSILVTHWPNCIELNPSSSRFQSSVVSGVRRRTTECEAARLGPRLCRGPVARRFELTDDHRPKRGGFASPPVTFQSFCAEL